MEELTKSQKARMAIRTFKTITDALMLRGFYRPSGKTGQTLAEALKVLSPEIYGSMNDPRIIELQGLEYVIDRLPKGIESCTRIILTAQEELKHTPFELVQPLKRRRACYRINPREMCFVITRGMSEIYDILTHFTFLNIEATKIRNQIRGYGTQPTWEWKQLEQVVTSNAELSGNKLDQAIWNLSIILGRTYQETRKAYESLEASRREHNANSGLFHLVYYLGMRVEQEQNSRDNQLLIYFTPALKDIIGHHKYGRNWALTIKNHLLDLGLSDRPIHIISANMHSVMNLIYGYAALKQSAMVPSDSDLYPFCQFIRDKGKIVENFAQQHGFVKIKDTSGSNIDCQIIDMDRVRDLELHPALDFHLNKLPENAPVLLVMDYAFGTQAFEVMDELLSPIDPDDKQVTFNFQSISVMGKAGILGGNKGDIMLATAHVVEGTAHNYIVDNDMDITDFDTSIDVYKGPILTVLGTSLQNRDVLKRFHDTSWKAVGLEMEGGHYHRAISAAIIRGHIPSDIKIRYAYYASDNPLVSGQTLASGPMGREGIRPTYMVTRVILKKIVDQATGRISTLSIK